MSNIYTYKEAQTVVEWFEELLRKLNITWSQKDSFEDKICNVIEFMWHYEKFITEEGEVRKRDLAIELVGLCDFAAKVLAAAKHPSFSGFIPHLEKVANCEFNLSKENCVTDSDADKIFELYMATLASQCGKEVDLDDPNESSNGENPDVIFTFQGKRIALACKTPHSDKDISIFKNIKKAVDQVGACDQCDFGIPVISLRNIIPSRDMFEKYRHHIDWPVAALDINNIINEKMNVIKEWSNDWHEEGNWNQNKCPPYVIFVSNLTVLLGDTFLTTPAISRMNTMILCELSGKCDESIEKTVKDLGHCLNHYCQIIDPNKIQP